MVLSIEQRQMERSAFVQSSLPFPGLMGKTGFLTRLPKSLPKVRLSGRLMWRWMKPYGLPHGQVACGILIREPGPSIPLLTDFLASFPCP